MTSDGPRRTSSATRTSTWRRSTGSSPTRSRNSGRCELVGRGARAGGGQGTRRPVRRPGQVLRADRRRRVAGREGGNGVRSGRGNEVRSGRGRGGAAGRAHRGVAGRGLATVARRPG